MTEPKGYEMAPSLPGLATPWPRASRWSTVRRLLAAWRWHYERGPADKATINAYNSVARRGMTIMSDGVPLGADILERGDDLRRLASALLRLEDFV